MLAITGPIGKNAIDISDSLLGCFILLLQRAIRSDELVVLEGKSGAGRVALTIC